MTIKIDDIHPVITRDTNSNTISVKLTDQDMHKMDMRCKEEAAKNRQLKGASANSNADINSDLVKEKSYELAKMIGGLNNNSYGIRISARQPRKLLGASTYMNNNNNDNDNDSEDKITKSYKLAKLIGGIR
ncbi:MAG TPA: hypothetical protein VJ729_16510 [Nitrososphaeraceae archaeon]|nr:hypothetical protein [Nitrososphaeraceae archaeon]